MEVKQSNEGIHICQRRFAARVLERFGIDISKAMRILIVPGTKLVKDEHGVKVDDTIYKQMVGSLMYLTVTRPNIL